MTGRHLVGLALAVAIAFASIIGAFVTLQGDQADAAEKVAALGVGFAMTMVTGILGHAQAERTGSSRQDDPEDELAARRARRRKAPPAKKSAQE